MLKSRLVRGFWFLGILYGLIARVPHVHADQVVPVSDSLSAPITTFYSTGYTQRRAWMGPITVQDQVDQAKVEATESADKLCGRPAHRLSEFEVKYFHNCGGACVSIEATAEFQCEPL